MIDNLYISTKVYSRREMSHASTRPSNAHHHSHPENENHNVIKDPKRNFQNQSVTSPPSPYPAADFDFNLFDGNLVPWNSDRLPPPYVTFQDMPQSFGIPTPVSTVDENCSNCCDKEDCSDVCENEGCINGGCVDCTEQIQHCDLKCAETTCNPSLTSCIIALPTTSCQTLNCDTPTCSAVASCDDRADGCCPENSCQQECDAGECGMVCAGHTAPCPDTTCHDFIWCAGSQSQHAFSNGLSFHINTANATRSQQRDFCIHPTSQYASISPDNLCLNGYHQNQTRILSDADFAHAVQYENGIAMDEVDLETQASPHKRRKISKSSDSESLEYNCNKYPSSPSSATPTPFPENLQIGDISCEWNHECDQLFMDSVSLQNHFKETHAGSLDNNRCLWSGCDMDSLDPGSLIDHVMLSHGTVAPKYVCRWDSCNATYTSLDEFRSHVNFHMELASDQCCWENCGSVMSSQTDFLEHVQSTHVKTQAVPNRLDIQEPIGRSDSEEVKVCEWHDVDAQGIPYCCRQTFKNSTELQQHAKDIHIAALKKRTGYFCRWKDCNRIDKPFSQKGKVERHLQTHTGFKSCTCPFCGKEFSAPQALQQHIRTHTGEKPYKCDVCGKEFAQGSAMTMHKRVHTGERPLKCDFPGCDKRFSESSNLSKHRKTHNPVGQHLCGFPGCDRSFHRLDQMKRHQKTHGVVFKSMEPI